MTWTQLTEDWPRLMALLPTCFPHAGAIRAPASPTDFTAILTDLAGRHDLTIAETAELLGDLSLGLHAGPPYVSDVTQRMLASS